MDNKDKIIELYNENNLNCVEIAEELGISHSYVSRILNKLDNYENEKNERNIIVDKEMIYMFCELKLECSEIAEKFNITASAVRKRMSKYKDYQIEKERRKAENKIKHEKAKVEGVYKKRQEQSEFNKIDKEEDEAIYAGMMMLQSQNAVSMSRKRKIGDDSLLKVYLNAYDYNKDKHSIVFNKRVGRCPNDLPEKKYWR